MEEAEFTREDVSQMVGIHCSTVHRFMIGERKPSYAVLNKFRIALRCDMNEMF